MTPNRDLADPRINQETLSAWARHLGVSTVDPVRLRARLGAGTLPSAFQSVARHRSRHPALTIGDRTLTHGEIDAAAAEAAGSLSALGIGPGESVILIAGTGIPEVVSYLGILRTGAAVVLVHPTLTATEIERIGEDTSARIVVGRGDGLRACSGSRMPAVRELIGLEDDDRAFATVLLSELRAQPMETAEIDPDSPAILAYTSGTTGRPKCAPLSHRNLLSSIRGAMWAWRWTREDRLVHALPISHQHGLSGIHATLLGGSRATILESFEPGALLEAISDGMASVLFAVPSIHQRLVAHLGESGRGLDSLRLVTSGSAPLPAETARRFEEVAGQRIVERYGTTESGLDVSNPYDGERIPGQVGIPLPGVEISVVDDNGEDVPSGEPGEVLVRGPQVFAGYLRPEPGSFRARWFRTGDQAVIDPVSGYLTLVGRHKELIITGGMNVYPREIEDVVLDNHAVDDVVVVGLPSERWGEEVVAFVAPETVDSLALSVALAGKLAPYKRPKRIYPVREIPRTSTGKLDRARLVELSVSSGGWVSPPSGI